VFHSAVVLLVFPVWSDISLPGSSVIHFLCLAAEDHHPRNCRHNTSFWNRRNRRKSDSFVGKPPTTGTFIAPARRRALLGGCGEKHSVYPAVVIEVNGEAVA
jgi:hypothetical protein